MLSKLSCIQTKANHQNQKTGKSLLLLFCLAIAITTIPNVRPFLAHKIQVAADVGATLHLEPNDNPRAGEPTKAWFALTRKGGKVIPLAECNCRLGVYAEPHTEQEPPLLEPSLQAVTAERYQGIPGAEITFPKPGIYELHLDGKPAKGASFKPFQLEFEVTVATGTAKSQNIQNVNSDVVKQDKTSLPLWAIAIPVLGAMGIGFFVFQKTRKN